MRRLIGVLCVALAVAAPAGAAVVFQNLGTAAPPGNLGPYAVGPFDQVVQATIADFTIVSVIPGSPIPGGLDASPSLDKRTVGSSWMTWSHGYTGAVYFTGPGGTTVTLTLPPNAGAFYLYAEPVSFGSFNVTATTNDGTTSGPIAVEGNAGANGFGFYTTAAGQFITTVTVDVDAGANGFAVGEFGIAASTGGIPTLGGAGIGLLVLLLAAAGVVLSRRLLAV